MDYLKIFTTLDSTNKEAQRLLAQGPIASGLTLLAEHQTDGRGQLGRPWMAAPDTHLAMSIIHKPVALSPAELPTLGMKVSLGIVRALRSFDSTLPLAIKWPNDIYLEDKKLCGILIENSLSGTTVQYSILGIGMNINESQFPPEIPNAISLLMATGRTYDIKEIALAIRDYILALLDHPSGWKKEYDHCVYGLDRKFDFITGGDVMEGMVKGVSLQGHLLLETSDQEIKSFASHEIKWVISV